MTTRTIGGKFNSIGDAEQVKANAELVTRLVREMDRWDLDMLEMPDLFFLDDTRRKLNQPGNKMFGWRQVEAIVRIHKAVKEAHHGSRTRTKGKS